MIVTLSPAKIMDFESEVQISVCSKPEFIGQANKLNDILIEIPVEEISKLMKINPKQAFTTYQQIQAYNLKRTPQRQAALAYNGIAYLGLDFKSLSEDNIKFAQNHLLILSGLYGALRPLDTIKPYRLEMQIKLENNKGKDLYTYWQKAVTKYFAERLNTDDKIWINLMSSEYTKTIDLKALPKGIHIITPNFKEQTSTGYRQVVVHTKKARGMMVRFIIENKINDLEHLKAFDYEGYAFSEELSKGNQWTFVR